MNFLAHALLSGQNNELILGGIIADSVKGKAFEEFDINVRKGISLHRLIDSYTDKNEIFIESVNRLKPKFKRYSSVIADIYYDHFLAANFSKYCSIPLNKFAEYVYKILIENYNYLPQRNKRILPYMITQNWFVSYSSFEGLQRVFDGMTKRAAFKSDMKDAVAHLNDNYDKYYTEFMTFFPQLQNYAIYAVKNLL